MNRNSALSLELLAPARTARSGRIAIEHGADAVYIGGTQFGARAAAGNDMGEIAQLCTFAHRYHAQVYGAVNTILQDHELATARQLCWQFYDAGADALIIQDMGLLQLDLPPLPLHASTQCDNRDAAKVRFLADCGFSQIVLARELSVAEITAIARDLPADVRLEHFVHGALCVSYSGQCYLSQSRQGRSANRGDCAQNCRLNYRLLDQNNRVLSEEAPLLSLKDNRQDEHLAALAAAGVRSFKIEGRLKDDNYVKNITAYYRQRLDELIAAQTKAPDAAGWRRSADGSCTFLFTPKPEKTFNRGYCDYFSQGRSYAKTQTVIPIHSGQSPAYVGEYFGTLADNHGSWFTVADAQAVAHNGDGLSYFSADGSLAGVRINRVEGTVAGKQKFYPATPLPALPAHSQIFRNRDQAFVHLLEQDNSAVRRIALDIALDEHGRLHLSDESGCQVCCPPPPGERQNVGTVDNPALANGALLARYQKQLSKLGATIFQLRSFSCAPALTTAAATEAVNPLPVLSGAEINAWRRHAVEQLENERLRCHPRAPRRRAVQPPVPYVCHELSYLGNVTNQQARAFYQSHGVSLIADGYEIAPAAHDDDGQITLMTTRYCLRHRFDLCPKQHKGIRPEPLVLIHGNERYTASFDCKACLMHLRAPAKTTATATTASAAITAS